MNDGTNKRLAGVWLGLCALTLGYLLIDHAAGHHGRQANEAVTIGAILIALTKIRIIMREFMDVRHAPRTLALITDGCVVLMALTLLACYFAGRHIGSSR